MHSTHGMALKEVGGHVPVLPGTEPELAAAAINPAEAVIQHNGRTIIAPIDQIDPDKVELACNMDGCALIPDDGNPLNDIDGSLYVPKYLDLPEQQERHEPMDRQDGQIQRSVRAPGDIDRVQDLPRDNFVPGP